MPALFENLSQILARRAATQPDRRAFQYLGELSGSTASLTFSALHTQAEALAYHLANSAPPGSRAVLLYPQSLDFIVAFMACLRAGIIAVPLSLPINRQDQARLLGVIADCDPSMVLTQSSIGRMPEVAMLAQMRPDVRLILTDEFAGTVDATNVAALPARGEHDVALLQYTSGSTGFPKGVVVTHANIMANQKMIQEAFRTEEHDVGLTWMPLYHDMGLIGCVMQSIYVGGLNYLMSPLDFLKRPQSWLEAISQYKVTISGGPDFAFSLCTKRLDLSQYPDLDLSSWRVAPNGAEPIKAATLKAFSEKFSERGFRESTCFPCYGLAEATLFVSGGPAERPYQTLTVDGDGLVQHHIIEAQAGTKLVSSGPIAAELDVQIVDPQTQIPVGPDHVGEIWVHGPSIASGYWQKEEATRDTFHANLAGGNRDYMRTGDLGFISHGGELIVTGRLKDLIILSGRNYYPQDFEAAAEHAHAAVRVGASAAFLAKDDDHGIVLVMELRKDAMDTADLAEIKSAVRRAVSQQIGIPVLDVAVLAPGKVLKTTSGKIRRADCRKEWTAGKLKDVDQSQVSTLPTP